MVDITPMNKTSQAEREAVTALTKELIDVIERWEETTTAQASRDGVAAALLSILGMRAALLSAGHPEAFDGNVETLVRSLRRTCELWRKIGDA